MWCRAPSVYSYNLSLLGNRRVDDPRADGTVVCCLPPFPHRYHLWEHPLVSRLPDSLVVYLTILCNGEGIINSFLIFLVNRQCAVGSGSIHRFRLFQQLVGTSAGLLSSDSVQYLLVYCLQAAYYHHSPPLAYHA